MITKYVIPFVNGGVEISTPIIEMTGYAGAPLFKDESPGGFFVDLRLTVGTVIDVSVRVEDMESQPEDTTSLESIKEWAIAQLDTQYGVPD